MKSNPVLLALTAVWLCGCQTYQYRIVQPATAAPVIDKAPIAVRDDPLDYLFSRYRDRLAVEINNPTDDRMVLQGGRSFTIDPQGESHPLRDRVIGPHSFTRLLLPPIPFTYAYPDYWDWGPGWGWGLGWYDPFWGGSYGPWFYGPPSLAHESVLTVYDWEWKSGLMRLRFSYDRNGKTFEHNFEIIREPAK